MNSQKYNPLLNGIGPTLQVSIQFNPVFVSDKRQDMHIQIAFNDSEWLSKNYINDFTLEASTLCMDVRTTFISANIQGK